jgi:hypothetical protein
VRRRFAIICVVSAVFSASSARENTSTTIPKAAVSRRASSAVSTLPASFTAVVCRHTAMNPLGAIHSSASGRQ